MIIMIREKGRRGEGLGADFSPGGFFNFLYKLYVRYVIKDKMD